MIEILVAVGVGVVLAIICFVIGGWLVFKSKASAGESLFRQPKGQVFTIPDADLAEDEPGDKKLLERTEKFLSMIGGK